MSDDETPKDFQLEAVRVLIQAVNDLAEVAESEIRARGGKFGPVTEITEKVARILNGADPGAKLRIKAENSSGEAMHSP